jgi:hypothetical protein
MKRDRPRAPTTIHGSSGPKFLPVEKANTTADSLENLFTPHELYDEHHELWMKARVQALLESQDNTPTLPPPPGKNKTL